MLICMHIYNIYVKYIVYALQYLHLWHAETFLTCKWLQTKAMMYAFCFLWHICENTWSWPGNMASLVNI